MFISEVNSWSTDAEIGRISVEEEPEVESIVCPRMTFGDLQVARPTMTESQCLHRLVNDPTCRRACTAVNHLRQKHHLPSADTPLTKPKRIDKGERTYKTCACGNRFCPGNDTNYQACPICRKIAQVARCKDEKLRMSLTRDLLLLQSKKAIRERWNLKQRKRK